MTVVVRRGIDRFVTREPGRQTRHSFSFGASYDPGRVSFGPLVALNDDLLAAGAGYDPHDHSDVVLVTWVVSGALAHQHSTDDPTDDPTDDSTDDSTGPVVQRAGEVAVVHAGAGITHSERAARVATRFVQAWLRPGLPTPGETGDQPVRRTRTPDLGGGDLVVVAGESDLGVPGATYRIAEIPAGATVDLPSAPLRYVFVATGALARSSLAEPLSAGDAFEITGEREIAVTAAVPTQVLVWSFDV